MGGRGAGGESGWGRGMQTHVNITRMDAGGAYSLLGAFGGGFGWGKNTFRVSYDNKNISRPFPCHWGAGWDGWQWGTLDDVLIIGHVINHWLSRRFLAVGFIWRGFRVGIGIILIELLIWDVFGCERG